MRLPLSDFMAHADEQQAERKREQEREAACFVRVMHTRADGSVVCTQEVRFASYASALAAAERMQRQLLTGR